MRLTRVWSDLYGCPQALYEGLPGGHRWLIGAAPADAAQVSAVLAGLNAKGSLRLIVHEDLTPLLAALQEERPRGAVVIGPNLSGGPAMQIQAREVSGPGVTYLEEYDLPAWTGALPSPAPTGPSPAAGLCTLAGVPVVACTPEHLAETLRAWWAVTPHSLVVG